MRLTDTALTGSDARAEILSLARPLVDPVDMQPLIDHIGGNHLVCIGEASHGTSEFYRWRAELSRRLITAHGFTWIGVEGDWPDCWRINRWVRGQDQQDLHARGVLAHFDRWPTWMWANTDVAEFLDWLHGWNLSRPVPQRVGFYGLDVYSLWDSLREIISWLEANAPDAIPTALRAWLCFVPYREDPHEYAWSTRLVPESCEPDVVNLLVEVRLRALLHRTLGAPAVLDFGENRSGPWLSSWKGQRAIGVVYHPENEAANYVPTQMGGRYDALIWLEETTALQVLHHETRPEEPEFETEPSGF